MVWFTRKSPYTNPIEMNGSHHARALISIWLAHRIIFLLGKVGKWFFFRADWTYDFWNTWIQPKLSTPKWHWFYWGCFTCDWLPSPTSALCYHNECPSGTICFLSVAKCERLAPYSSRHPLLVQVRASKELEGGRFAQNGVAKQA